MKRESRTVAAGEFKARCLALLDEVAETGESFIVTKRGRPVAEVVPCREVPSLKGSIVREADLISPVDETWNADA